MSPRTALFAVFITLSVFQARADDPAAAFQNPPPVARPYVYWFWMGRNITKEGITGDLEALKGAGFGGAVMCNLSDCCTPWNYEIGNGLNPDMVPYVSDSWWELVRHAASEARRLGLDFGMGDCAGYETSGGPWITPELSVQQICHSETPVAGPGKVSVELKRPEVDPHSNTPWPIYNPENGKVEKPVIEGRKTFYRDIAALALPADGVVPLNKVIDVSSRMSPEGHLDWDAPPGKWIVYRFGHTTAGLVVNPAIWKATGLECDKMNPDAVSFHSDHIIGELKKHLGGLLGNGLKFIWIDSYEYGDPAWAWTERMREEFKARRGYDMTPFLPTRARRTIGSGGETAKFDKDFHRTVYDLFRDVHYGVTSQKAHAAGLEFRNEPYSGPWNMDEVVPKLDQAAGEFWNDDGRYSPMAISAVVKATRLVGQNIVNSEAFTALPQFSEWDETPARLKPVGDAAYCDGVNRFILHRFTHEPWNDRYKPGVVMGQWGTHFDRTQTWWEPGKAWVSYLTRCQALLQWGRPVPTPPPADFQTDTLNYAHRSDGRMHVYFVVNTTSNPAQANCKFSVTGLQPELWNPVTGTMRDLEEFKTSGGQTIIPLQFAPAESCFVVFRHPVARGRKGRPQLNFPTLQPVMEIAGPWQVRFDSKWGGPESPATFEQLTDWTENSVPGIKYYSGTAVYSHGFNVPAGAVRRELSLDLGKVNHLARVKINGADLGVVWTAPWQIAIPAGLVREGANTLEIDVTNVWANRLIGDEQEPPDCEWQPGYMGHGEFLKKFPDWFVKGAPRPSQGRYCFTTWNYFNKRSPLVPSGLLGPVRLLAPPG